MGLTESNHCKNSFWGSTKSKNSRIEAVYEGKPRQAVTLPAIPTTKDRESRSRTCVDDTFVSSSHFRSPALTNGQISYNSKNVCNYLPDTQPEASRSPSDYYSYCHGEPFYILPSTCPLSEIVSPQLKSTNQKGRNITSRKSRSSSENCRKRDSSLSRHVLCEEISFNEKETQTFPEPSSSLIAQNLKKKKKRRSTSAKRSTSYKEYSCNPVKDFDEQKCTPKKLSYSVPTTPSEVRSDPYICLYYSNFDDELPNPFNDKSCISKHQVLSETSSYIPSKDKKIKNKKSQIYIQLDDNFNKKHKSESSHDQERNLKYSNDSMPSPSTQFNTHKSFEVKYKEERNCSLCNKNLLCNFHGSECEVASDLVLGYSVENLTVEDSHLTKLQCESNSVVFTRDDINCYENSVENHLLTYDNDYHDKSDVLYYFHNNDYLKPQFLSKTLNIIGTGLDLQNTNESLHDSTDILYKKPYVVPILENQKSSLYENVSMVEKNDYSLVCNYGQRDEHHKSKTFSSCLSRSHGYLDENKQHFQNCRTPLKSPDKKELLSHFLNDENQSKINLRFDNGVKQISLDTDAERDDSILQSQFESQVSYLSIGNNNNIEKPNRAFNDISQQFQNFRIENCGRSDAIIDSDFCEQINVSPVLERENLSKSLPEKCSLNNKKDFQCYPQYFSTLQRGEQYSNKGYGVFKKSPFDVGEVGNFHILRLPTSAEQPKLAEVLKKHILTNENTKPLDNVVDNGPLLDTCSYQMNKTFLKDDETEIESMTNVKSFNDSGILLITTKDNSNTDSQTLLKKELKSKRNLFSHIKDLNLFSSNMNTFPNKLLKSRSKTVPIQHLRRSNILDIPKRFFSLPLKPPFDRDFSFDCNLTCHEQCQNVVSLDCKLKSPDLEYRRPSSPSLFHEEDVFLDIEEDAPLIKQELDNKEEEEEKEEEEDNDEEDYKEAAGEKYEEEILEKEILQEKGLIITDTKQEISTLRRTVRRIQSQVVDSLKIEEWVQKCPSNNVGLQITKEEDGGYRGCLRIHLNLSRPINIVAGTRPPSIYDILQEDRTLEKTLTSFYMPRDTVKAIHITSKTTTREVIVALLRKFKVVDNPQKFALYERTYDAGQSMKAKLRRLGDNECPLVLAIAWNAEDITNKRLVLQENDTADIQWEAFSLPELDNFLRILDREEGEYKNQIRDKYSHLRQRLQWQLSRLSSI